MWFLVLATQVLLYSLEMTVVRAQKLWPRSIRQPPLTSSDRTLLEALAKQEERRPEESTYRSVLIATTNGTPSFSARFGGLASALTRVARRSTSTETDAHFAMDCRRDLRHRRIITALKGQVASGRLLIAFELIGPDVSIVG